MQKLMAIAMIVMIMTVGSVLGLGVGPPDEECFANGFDFGIAKYGCGTADGWKLSDGGERAGYTTSATGTCLLVDWTSDPAAEGVLSKEGTTTFVNAGGTSGTVTSFGKEISHITLCGGKGVDEIPEFTGLGASLALAGAGLYIYRRKRNKT